MTIPQSVAVISTLAQFQSSNVSAYGGNGAPAQLAYLQGTTSDLDGGQAFYQLADNDYSTDSNPPYVIVDGANRRWFITSVVSSAQIVAALTSAGTVPGLDPLSSVSANIAAATTTDLSTATGNYVNITGAGATITGLGTVTAGRYRFCTFAGINTLTHNATSLILPGGANITTAAGDFALFVSLGSGNWKCIVYTEASGGTPGTLPVSEGGTGKTTLTNHGVMLGQGTSAVAVTAVGATGTVLKGSTGADPSFGAVALTTDVSGVLPVANGGTNASSASITAFNNITGYTAAGATGTTSTNLVFSTSPTLVTPALGTPSSGVLSSCTGYPFSALTGSASIAQMGSSTYSVERIIIKTATINFNSANTDTVFAITLPTGFSRYVCTGLRISNTQGNSGNASSATFGLFTAAGAGGSAIVASGTACTITNNTDGTANNNQAPAVAIGANTSFSVAGFPNLYFRVQTAQGAAVTADVQIIIVPE